MGADATSTPSRPLDENNRRRLLTLMGAGGAAALATLVSSKEAQAAHGGDNTFHLGEYNNAPVGSFPGNPHHTILDGPSSAGALKVINSSTGAAIEAHASSTGVVATQTTPGQAAVVGMSNDEGEGDGSGIGVLGQSGSGDGVQGSSDSGVAGRFFSTSGESIHCDGPAGIFADKEGQALSIGNNHTSGDGISASAHGQFAVEGVHLGTSPQPGQAGVIGVSGEGEDYGEGPGTGVLGAAGTGTGVSGFSPSTGTAVMGNSLEGIGVRAYSEQGTALSVGGKAAFSTAGSATVPDGDDSVFVASEVVTADSHITVTLVSDPGPRTLAWVERDPGNGFTVHLTSTKPKDRSETGFTYLIVEPD